MTVDISKAEPVSIPSYEAVGKLLGYSVESTRNPFSPKLWTTYIRTQGNYAPMVINGLSDSYELAIEHGWNWVWQVMLGGHHD